MKKVAKVMRVSLSINALLSILKVVCGIIGKSSALIADGVHSFSDLVTDIFSIIGNALSRKPADQKHPYGHGKFEYLTSIVIGSVVLFLGLSIIYKSTQKEIVIPSILVVFVSMFTIVAKFFLARYILRKGYEYKNNILIAGGKESNADVLSSVFVLISGVLMQFADTVPYLKYADTVATIIVGILIVRVGFLILKENISIVLGEQETDQELIDETKEIILKNEEVISIDSLVLLKFGSYYKVTCELGMDGNLTLFEAHEIVNKVEKRLKKNKRIQYLTIHMNPVSKEAKE